VSRRDLVRVLDALWRLWRGDPEVGVPVADIDEMIGRGHGEMRTSLNLRYLRDRVPGGPAAAPEG
jgi:hypothetical protein